MSKKCFGIDLNGNFTEKDTMDIAARLFLNPYITTEQAKLLVSAIENGKISMDVFRKKTDAGLNDLASWNGSVISLNKQMNNKLKEWSNVFGAPCNNDFEYIAQTYNLSKSFLFGEKAVIEIRSAKDMSDYVKQYIKGQDLAIEQLSVPFFLHLDSKRNQYTSKIKTPVILMGPTGSGKSEVLRLFGKLCDCPVVRINSSEVVPSGWKGLHITDILCREISNVTSIKDLEYAIIIFHEFDKITHYGQRMDSSTSGNWDSDMMRDFIRLFETEHDLFLEAGFDKDTMAEKSYRLPVDNLLVVFDGAFHGIETIIKRRLNIAPRIGFSSTRDYENNGVNILKYVTNEDLEQWGYMPDLIGRIGNTIVMNPLSANVIYEIMTSAKGNVISSHVDYCAKNNIELRFSEEALRYIADKAEKSGLGFRNVKAMLSKAMYKLYYEMPTSTSADNPAQKKVVEISRDFICRSLSN